MCIRDRNIPRLTQAKEDTNIELKNIKHGIITVATLITGGTVAAVKMRNDEFKGCVEKKHETYGNHLQHQTDNTSR